jgi:parvulin-like peptidyl-prolyl isomerase
MQMIKSLAAEGVTYEKYRQQVRDEIIIQALRAKNVSQEILISPHKVEEYYLAHRDEPEYKVEDQVKLRIIILNKTSDANAPVAQKMGEEILARLDAGVSFEEMSKEQGQERSGDKGWVGKTVLRKELTDAAFALKPGQHSGVIDTPEACYLLFVEGARPAHTKPLSEVRDEIEGNLLLAEQKRLEQQWVDRLKKKTFVRYY